MVGARSGHTPENFHAGLKGLSRNGRYLLVAAIAMLPLAGAVTWLPAIAIRPGARFATPLSLPVYSSFPVALKPVLYGAAGFLTFLTLVGALRCFQMLAGIGRRTAALEVPALESPRQASRPAETEPHATSPEALPSPAARHANMLDVAAAAITRDARSRLRPHFSGLRRRYADSHLDRHYPGPYRRATDAASREPRARQDQAAPAPGSETWVPAAARSDTPCDTRPTSDRPD